MLRSHFVFSDVRDIEMLHDFVNEKGVIPVPTVEFRIHDRQKLAYDIVEMRKRPLSGATSLFDIRYDTKSTERWRFWSVPVDCMLALTLKEK